MAIIYDLPGYKLDAQWSPSTEKDDGWWLEVTSFRKKSETEWITKTTRFSPEAQKAIAAMLASGPPK